MLSLLKQFTHAGLDLRIARTPLDGGRRVDSAEIVQLDIARDRDRERYVIFPGNETTNRVEVTSADRMRRQLVLAIAERARARHFLCGRDEQHLFIALLPRAVANVTEAHDVLAPEIPPEYARGIVRRQGEWFFAPVTAAERAELNLAPRTLRGGGLADAARIRRHGRQHLATEAVLLPQDRLYARGQIWHPDHAPVALRGVAPRVPQSRAVRTNHPARSAGDPLAGLSVRGGMVAKRHRRFGRLRFRRHRRKEALRRNRGEARRR